MSLYKKIIDDTSYYEIYDKTVKYILKRMRSKSEVVNYIKKYTNDLDIIDSIINKLEKINLINDKLYCKSFINDNIFKFIWY
ncbi:MAG: RecX family transcriptional regulator [bacterium]|nr:RecX family transcriptional regulator [bacterium]